MPHYSVKGTVSENNAEIYPHQKQEVLLTINELAAALDG